MAHWNNGECTCIDTQNKQWQNVGGSMSQDHATEVTRVMRFMRAVKHCQTVDFGSRQAIKAAS